MVLYILAIFFLYMQQKWDQGTLGTQRSNPLCLGPGLVLHWTLPWPNNTPDMVLYILDIFLHSMQQKWDHHGPTINLRGPCQLKIKTFVTVGGSGPEKIKYPDSVD